MTQKKLTVILGTAHGKNVAGKRSPDGKFQEWEYSREIVERLRAELAEQDELVDVFVDIPAAEVPLPQQAELTRRVRYVNQLCAHRHTERCIYVVCDIGGI